MGCLTATANALGGRGGFRYAIRALEKGCLRRRVIVAVPGEEPAASLRHHQLTHLPNRLSLTEHASDRRRARSAGVCVFYIDLDGFKSVNDTYDHEVGDDVPKEIRRRLAGSKRETDFLGHPNGDEFVLIAEGINADHEAYRVVERILRSVEQPMEHRVGTVRVSASVGYRFLSDGVDLDEPLRHADRGVAEAKQARAIPSGRAGRRT